MATRNDAVQAATAQESEPEAWRKAILFAADDDPTFACDFDEAVTRPSLLLNPEATAATLLASGRARIERAHCLCKVISGTASPDRSFDLVNFVAAIEPLLYEAALLLEEAKQVARAERQASGATSSEAHHG